MKGKRHHHDGKHAEHRSTGGANEAEQDVKDKPEEYNHSKVEAEAEERKRGGRTKRRHGGHVEKKHVAMHGEHEKHRLDRKPRKNGGRTGADKSPFSSARHGTLPPGRKEMDENC